MTDILPIAGWPNVRQLETNEFATGGSNGNMNEQAKSLAARSELLKQYAALPYESKTGGYALNERVQLATGDIVRSTIASNVKNPNENMTGWEVPSLKPTDNLSDVPNKAAARSNLSVYSQAQVDNAISNATIPYATETVAGKAKIATTAIAQAGVNDTDFLTAKKLRKALNAEGDAPISPFRAKICFNGTTTPPTILSSMNISSIIENATGDYTVTFTKPFLDTNYCYAGSVRRESSGSPTSISVVTTLGDTKTTSQFRFRTAWYGGAFDYPEVTLGVF